MMVMTLQLRLIFKLVNCQSKFIAFTFFKLILILDNLICIHLKSVYMSHCTSAKELEISSKYIKTIKVDTRYGPIEGDLENIITVIGIGKYNYN